MNFAIANGLINLNRHTREGRVAEAFTGNPAARKRMIRALRLLGYGKGVSDTDERKWLEILWSVLKTLLPLLLPLILGERSAKK